MVLGCALKILQTQMKLQKVVNHEKNTYFVAQVYIHCISQCFLFLCVCFAAEPENLSLDGHLQISH